MAYRIEKQTEDLVIDGFEKGIASSPHKGIANMQNVNISTEQGEVMVSYGRVKQSQTAAVTGTLTAGSGGYSVQFTNTGGTLLPGSWIRTGTSTLTGVSSNTVYYVSATLSGVLANISATYTGTPVTGSGGGNVTYTIYRTLGTATAKATEDYTDDSGVQQYRYYILDSNGFLWVHDSADTQILWKLPFTDAVTNHSTNDGLAVLNGWLFLINKYYIYAKPTIKLGNDFSLFSVPTAGGTTGGFLSNSPHFALVGHQGKLYYTDENYIGSIFPDSSLASGQANIQTYAKYTAVTTAGTIATLINGSLPSNLLDSSRIPAAFFTTTGGTVPTAITEGKLVWIQYTLGSAGGFAVYAAQSGGSALDIQTGSAGNQYFNTFYPILGAGSDTTMTATLVFTPQRLNLPFFETAQCIGEVGNLILIGTKSNAIYPWNQIDPLPSDIISLPESNAVRILNVNNMGIILAGNKGNIYITNGSTASGVISVPDYCAGIAGTPSTYIEPYFTWGDIMYLRGRVYFSILDQTSTKAGNCGGIWSFIPTQNMFIGQDAGMALRLENQNSYGTYSGVATILIPNETQTAISPQYYSAWYSSVSGPLYGIDGTNTVTSASAIIETDLIPTGTMLDKRTFQQIEYKLSTPLAVGESVTISYRQNSTASFATCGTAVVESTTSLSGYFTINFEKGQWLQLQIVLTPLATSSSTFCRLREIRVR